MELPGVAEAALAARDTMDRLLAHLVLRRRSTTVSAESALRGAHASARLEGADSGLDEVRSGAGGPYVRGALRVSAELGSMAETWPRAPRQVLARLHVLAARDLAPAESLGRPASNPEISSRLDGLAGLVANPAAGPAVLLAAVVHGELLTLAPFDTANGIVARAASRLCLISRGLDPKALSVPELGHAPGVYAATAEVYGEGSTAGVAAWLRHCCAAVELGALEGLAICEWVARG